MMKSMTGYGRATGKIEEGILTIEIKALNAKNSDIRIKAPLLFLDKEIDLKKMILKEAKRGKLEVSISLLADSDVVQLDSSVLTAYIKELLQVKASLGLHDIDVMQSALRIPNVLNPKDISLSPNSWNLAKNLVIKALEKLNEFRKAEGKALYIDLSSNIQDIQKAIIDIEPFELERISNLRLRMMNHLLEFKKNDQLDQNRFEQEVLFYMEKLDINEEKVRLEQHCNYFLEQLKDRQEIIGRKLGFIAQEIGREVNTIGSKAQHIEIQKIVVGMKDALEKMKEQINNVL